MTAPPAGARRGWKLSKPLRDAIAGGHPWVFDRALTARRDLGVGEQVVILDDRGPCAVAFADPGSPIAARVLDLDVGATIDADWARQRARSAAAIRVRDPRLASCSGIRWIHGEGDRCPGLVIDGYAGIAVVVYDGPAAAAFWQPFVPAVLDGLRDAGADIRAAWVRGDRRGGQAFAIGAVPDGEIAIHEDEAKFFVDVRRGQKTGFFLDQRENRRLVRSLAAGARVLNVCCYTGGFSIHAALGGAASVSSIDLAAPALATLERNWVLSGLGKGEHESLCGDAFEVMGNAARQGRQWDLVVVDPPSFAPSERAKPQALRAYRKLAEAALAVTTPGGRFALASCSSHVSEADLCGAITGLHRDLRITTALSAASDHPILPAFPEGKYLKFLLCEV